MKNRVPSFDMFVRLDEQASAVSNDASSFKMMKSKLKSAAYNASSAIATMESNPGCVVDPYIIARIAVAADYLDSIEEYFRNYEGDASASPMDTPMDTHMDTHMDDLGGEDSEDADSQDDETEDEVEDAPEEE